MEKEIGDGELSKILSGLNWDILAGRKKEFIISMVVKKLRGSGVLFFKKSENKRIVVVPVTVFDRDDVIQRNSPFVYEFYRDWVGEVLKESNNGVSDQCTVRIRRNEKSKSLITVILKADLHYE